MSTVISKINQSLLDSAGIAEEDIANDATWEDLGLDNLDEIEFFMDIEEVFGIEISDSEAEGIHTINALIEFLEKEHDIV